MVKLSTLSTVFAGSGSPPTPWLVTHAGTGLDPVQTNGALDFPGVFLPGSLSGIEADSVWDISDDRALLQWAQLNGRPGTIEWQLQTGASTSFQSLVLRIQDQTWRASWFDAASVEHLAFAGAVTPPDPLVWSIECDHSNNVNFYGGPTPASMVLLGTTGPVALGTLQDIEFFFLNVSNQATHDLVYGDALLIAVNAYVNQDQLDSALDRQILAAVTKTWPSS